MSFDILHTLFDTVHLFRSEPTIIMA